MLQNHIFKEKYWTGSRQKVKALGKGMTENHVWRCNDVMGRKDIVRLLTSANYLSNIFYMGGGLDLTCLDLFSSRKRTSPDVIRLAFVNGTADSVVSSTVSCLCQEICMSAFRIKRTVCLLHRLYIV